MENPEMNKIETVEVPERKWSEDITIPVPLNEYMRLKKKVLELKQEVKEQRSDKYDYMNKALNAEEALEELKKDYQKLLGITEKGDDGK